MTGFLTPHRRLLQIIWVALALLWLGLVLGSRAGNAPSGVGGRTRIALFIPVLVLFVAVHLALMYQSWIQRRRKSILRTAGLVFFCVLTGLFVLILAGLSLMFLF